MRATLGAVLLLTLLPVNAMAASIEDIVRLSGAGVSEEVILAVIERDKTIFSLSSDDLVALRTRGVSERVVLAMLKSGREEAAVALQHENEQRAAEFANAALEGPTVIIIGHGPDRPNTGRYDWYFPYPFAGLYSPIVVAPPAFHHGMVKDPVFNGAGLPSCASGLTIQGVGGLAMPPCSSAMIPVQAAPVQPRPARQGRLRR